MAHPILNAVAIIMVMMCFVFTIEGCTAMFPVLPKAKKHGTTFALKDVQVLLKKRGLMSLTMMMESSISVFPLVFLWFAFGSGIEGTGAVIALCGAIFMELFTWILFLNCWAVLSFLVFSLMFKSFSPIERLARFVALGLSIYVFATVIDGVGRLGIGEELLVASFNNKQHVAHDLAALMEQLALLVAVCFVASMFHCLVASLLLHRFVLYAEKRGGCAFHDKVALYWDKNYSGKDFDDRIIKKRKSTIKNFKLADKYKHAVAFLSVVYFVVMS